VVRLPCGVVRMIPPVPVLRVAKAMLRVSGRGRNNKHTEGQPVGDHHGTLNEVGGRPLL